MARFEFALKMIWARFDGRRSHCPYCASRLYSFMQRKKLLIEARRCQYCGLIYRWPISLPNETVMFYNSGAYNGQQATHLPELDTLPILIQQDFKGSEWDKIYRVDFIRRTTECCGKLLDFGCSWGYGTYQYKNIGFETVGLEINRSQVEFGRTHLKLDLYSEWKELGNIYFDVILADHSLEHLSNLKETLDAFQTYSKEGSKLIIFVPNGNSNQTRHFGPKWGVGEPHTVLFTMEWFLKNLPRHHFSPHFFTPRGDTLPTEEYLSDESEIALVATRV